MGDEELIAELRVRRCWTQLREDMLRRGVAEGCARKAWDAAEARFWIGADSSSNSSMVSVIPGAGVDDDGFGVALEQELRRALRIVLVKAVRPPVD